MSKIVIMTDSASDISPEIVRELDIKVLPFTVILDGASYTSGVDMTTPEFYDLMARSGSVPTTSQITVPQFMDIFTREAAAGTTNLIAVLINSKGSATYANALQAREQFAQLGPDTTRGLSIDLIDGMGYSALYGEPVVRAAHMRAAGATASDIVSYLQDTIPQRDIYFGVYELTYAAQSGRIPTAAALVGSKLNIKPIMRLHDRAITTAAKCHGEQHLIERIARLSTTGMASGSPYEIIYGSDLESRDEMDRVMAQRVGYHASGFYQVGPAVAANSGPRVVGVAFERRAEQ